MPYHPSAASVKLQTSPAYYVVSKAANTIGYFSVVYLTWRFFWHRLDWHLATGCIIISGCWLVLTAIKTDHLLQTYFDILSRVELQLPVALGIGTSVVSLFAHGEPWYPYVAVAEICGWIWIYLLYRRNKTRFEKQGHGPVPIHTWINPPASILKPGDLILTSGNVATTLHETVGHAEMVLNMPEGETVLFSSYMAKGACLLPIDTLSNPDKKRFYIALYLSDSWTPEQSRQAAQIAEEMVETNQKWAERQNARLSKLLGWLPLPSATRKALKQRLHQTGYDWFGMFLGRVAEDHWTCIGADLELYKRMGVKTRPYGTGLLGFGTTLFDPIMPVRFLSDPAFELIKSNKGKPSAASKVPDKRTSV